MKDVQFTAKTSISSTLGCFIWTIWLASSFHTNYFRFKIPNLESINVQPKL